MKQVARLMTHEEEKILAKKIRGAETEEERIKLRNEFAEKNLALVISIAKRHTTADFPIEDLFQEGSIGLLRAIEKFDPNSKFKFSTYATYWIKQHVQRAMADQARTIRIPLHMIEIWKRYKKVELCLRAKLGRNPDVEEVAVEMLKRYKGNQPKKLENLIEKLKTVIESMRVILSLDEYVLDNRSATAHEIVRDPKGESEFNEFKNDETLRKFRKIIRKTITKREMYVLEKRFKERLGLREIGEIMGISHQRVGQIEQEAFEKIKKKIKNSQKLRNIIVSDERLTSPILEKIRN